MQRVASLGNVREAFAHPDARRLLRLRLIAQAGDGLFQASLASAVFFNPESATNPRQAALGFIVFYLPYSLVGPFAGVFLDRWRRTRIAVVANIVRAGFVALAMTALLTLGTDAIGFYAAALGVLGMSRFYLSSLNAALPHVVPTHRLVTGNAVMATSGTVTAFSVAIFALLSRDLLGEGITGNARFGLLAGGMFLVAAYAATRIQVSLGPANPATTPLRDALGTVVAEMARGARHVRATPRAARALAVVSAHRFLFGLALISTVLLYRNTFDDTGVLPGGEAGLATAVATTTVGILTAAVLTPRILRRISKQTWITRLLLAAACAFGLLAPTYTPAAILLASGILGFVSQGLRIAIDTIVQEDIADDFRGRVFSFYDMLFNLALVTSAAAAAFVLPTSGKSYAVLAVITIGYVATATIFTRLHRREASGVGESGVGGSGVGGSGVETA